MFVFQCSWLFNVFTEVIGPKNLSYILWFWSSLSNLDICSYTIIALPKDNDGQVHGPKPTPLQQQDRRGLPHALSQAINLSASSESRVDHYYTQTSDISKNL